MTPLAMHITKQLTLPVKRRTFVDHGGLLSRMADVHCFEVTEVFELAEQLGLDMIQRDVIPAGVLSFLPAEKTWLEWQAADGTRNGVLLEQDPDGPGARLTWAYQHPSGAALSHHFIGRLLLSPNSWDGVLPYPHWVEHRTAEENMFFAVALYGLLAIINTPRIIGRRQHMPHRGLERKLIAAMKPQGKFPLHAWTEIVLEVKPPKDGSREPSSEAHLTGKRAMHFCRAHLRIRNGWLEFVSSHWRGDASLGIKQSRYRLAAPARAA